VAVNRSKVFYYYLLPLVVSEWKEIIIKIFVVLDGHYNKGLLTHYVLNVFLKVNS
jgi:hypothetical protein